MANGSPLDNVPESVRQQYGLDDEEESSTSPTERRVAYEEGLSEEYTDQEPEPTPEPEQPARGRGDTGSGPESVGPPPEPEQPTRGRGDTSSGPSSTAPERPPRSADQQQPPGETTAPTTGNDTPTLEDLPTAEELENLGDSGVVGQETVKPDRETTTGTTRDDLQEGFEDTRSDLLEGTQDAVGSGVDVAEDAPSTVADVTGDTYSSATDLIGEGYGVATEAAADTQALQNVDNVISAIAAAEEEAGEPLTGSPGELEQALGEEAGDLAEQSGAAKDWADKYVVERGTSLIGASLEVPVEIAGGDFNPTSKQDILEPDTGTGKAIENALGGFSTSLTSIFPGGVESAVKAVDTGGDATETLMENVEEEGTTEGVGESGETAAQFVGQAGSALYEQATENPARFGGQILGDVLAGAGIAKGLEKASDITRGVRIARRGDSDTVDYGDTTTEAGTQGELPRATTDPDAPTQEAVEEVRERAQDNPEEIIPEGSEGAIYHTTDESLPGDLDVGEGRSELPGLFGSPEASPIGLEDVGGSSGYSPGIRLPNIRGSSDEIVTLPGDDVRGIPRGRGGSGYELRDPDTGEQVTGGLGRGEAKSMAADSDLEVRPDQTTSGYEFLTEQAEEGAAYVRPSGQRTTELEAIFGPGSEFVEEGVTPVRIGGVDIPGTDVTIPGTGRVVPARRFTRTGDSDTDVDTTTPDAPDSDVSPTAYEDVPTSQLSSRSGTPVGPPPGMLSPSTTTTTGETTQSTGGTPTSTGTEGLDSVLSDIDSQVGQVASDLESGVNDATDALSGLSDSAFGGLTGGIGSAVSDTTPPTDTTPPSSGSTGTTGTDTTTPFDTTPTGTGPTDTTPPTDTTSPTTPPSTGPTGTGPTDTMPPTSPPGTTPPGETPPPSSNPPTTEPPTSGPPETTPPTDTTPPSSPPSSGPPTSSPPATTPPTSPTYTPPSDPPTKPPRFNIDTDDDEDEDRFFTPSGEAQAPILTEFRDPLAGGETDTPENPSSGFFGLDDDNTGFDLW